MLEINTWRDPYDAGFTPTRPKKISFEEGLTVLVGCNGAGKSTLLRNIESDCRKNKIPHYFYDNLKDGGGNAMNSALAYNDLGLLSVLASSSEGESIKVNFGNLLSKTKKFLETGTMDTLRGRMANLGKALRCGNVDDEIPISNTRVLLFDALDSGLSVDSIVEIKDVLDLVMEDAKKYDIELYIIVAANEYELARNSNCFDVNNGKYIRFKDYEEYRSFIIKNRKKKELRIKRQDEYEEKKREKEITSTKIEIEKKKNSIQKIKETSLKENKEIFILDRWKLEDLERNINRLEQDLNDLEKYSRNV